MKASKESQTKICQNCKGAFIIDAPDFAFYEKMEVPAPTWCPECRAQRRLTFRNELTFYKRNCDLCKKDIVSIYHKDVSFPVYCPECWYSDKWDAINYGQTYDFTVPFFEQNRQLRSRVPRMALLSRNNINSHYINIGANNKNCYFVIEGSGSEDCSYGYWLEDHCKDVVDGAFLRRTEIAYDSLFLWNCFKIFFSKDCWQCMESSFLLDCIGVEHSLGCVNLRNKKYYIFNKPYSPEDYKKKLQEYNLGSFAALTKFKEEFRRFALLFPRRAVVAMKSSDFSGDYIINSSRCYHSFFIEDGEDIKYGVRVMYNVKDHMDVDTVGVGAQLTYESINTALGAYRMKFCTRCWTSTDCAYCDNCDNINFCFGSISLRNKSYCILNKQYAKEEYESLIGRITEHMNSQLYVDKKGIIYTYGEFFPPELSPLAYNESIAQKYFPLTKQEAIKRGYTWRDPETRHYQITLTSEALPDHIKDVNDSILNEIIGCAHKGACQDQCTEAFRIIPQELTFYRKQQLPLPRLCPHCRHFERVKKRNPLKLWKRTCMCGGKTSDLRPTTNDRYQYENTSTHFHGANHCPNEFETTYSPERQEIVYCEGCYNSEVI